MHPEIDPNPYAAPDAGDLPAPETAPPRPWGPWATAGIGVLVAGTFVVAQTVAFLVAWIGFRPDGASPQSLAADGDILGALTLVSGTAALGAILLAILQRGQGPGKYLGFVPLRRGWHLLPWLVLTIALGFGHSSLGPVFGVENPPAFMLSAWHSTQSLLLLALGVAFMAPLFEETFFRGFLHSGWAPGWMGWVGSAILTSLLWTVIHLQYGWYELTFIFVLGLCLAAARHHTGSLWTPLLMHAANNSLSLVAMAVEVGLPDPAALP
jgi:membrane protease YdiL (CAAX protease family)